LWQVENRESDCEDGSGGGGDDEEQGQNENSE
jgi:hypothetical protein